MKRVGLYTGNIYDNAIVEPSDLKECCLVLHDQMRPEVIEGYRRKCRRCRGNDNCIRFNSEPKFRVLK